MTLPDRDDADAFNQCVDEYRALCLWFVRPDYYPTTDAERHRILEAIERYGTVAAFARARTFKVCLSPSSSVTSVT